VFAKIRSADDASSLQRDLDRLVQWAREWQMMFNVKKCKVMHMGRKNPRYQYKMNGQILETVKQEKDLGVVISEDLKVSNQCNMAYLKANRTLGLIKRTIEYKSEFIMLRLYKSLVRPHLEYCTAAWSPYYIKDKCLLERVQHRFTRLIPGMKELSYSERLAKMGLMTLEERRNRSDLIEMFKMVKGYSKVSLDTFFEFDTTNRTRGHSLKLKKKRCFTDLRRHFFAERVVDNWNRLSEAAVSATTVNGFKNHLMKDRSAKMGLLKD